MLLVFSCGHQYSILAYSYLSYLIRCTGDFFSRCSIFDVVTSNTIPVIAPSVLPHLPYTDFVNYTDMLVLRNDTDPRVIVDLRATFNEATAMEMIHKKFALRHLYQYSVTPNHTLVTLQNRNIIDPQDDAFTFTLKTMLRSWCKGGFYKLLKCIE